jgi:hypothetical protein
MMSEVKSDIGYANEAMVECEKDLKWYSIRGKPKPELCEAYTKGFQNGVNTAFVLLRRAGIFIPVIAKDSKGQRFTRYVPR